MIAYLLVVTHLLPVVVHDPDSEDELLSVVVVEYDIQVVSEPGCDLLRNLSDRSNNMLITVALIATTRLSQVNIDSHKSKVPDGEKIIVTLEKIQVLAEFSLAFRTKDLYSRNYF